MMDTLILRAADGIDPETEAHFRLISSIKNTLGNHTHDFFEIFLIVNGSVVHCVNGKKQLLDKNSLVFIREKDVHYYEQNKECDC
jgi:AraC family cel operon transcriptional repressor